MTVHVTDIDSQVGGEVRIHFNGPNDVPPGTTTIITTDTPEDAPVGIELYVDWYVNGGRFGVQFAVSNEHYHQLLSGTLMDVLLPHEPSSDIAPKQTGPAIYESTATNTLVQRDVLKLGIEPRPNLTHEVTLELGIPREYDTHIPIPDTEPTARITLSGPLMFTCGVHDNGAYITDLAWQTPFCARVKAEYQLGPYLD